MSIRIGTINGRCPCKSCQGMVRAKFRPEIIPDLVNPINPKGLPREGMPMTEAEQQAYKIRTAAVVRRYQQRSK